MAKNIKSNSNTRKSSNMVDISSSSKRRKKSLNKKKSRVKKIFATFGKVIISLVLILIITGSIMVTALTVYAIKFVEPMDDIDLKDAGLGYATSLIATDADGNETEIANLHSTTIREWVDLDQIPESVRMAFVCAEDRRFYDHDGVDWKRTFAAFANLFLHFYSSQQGGSTITQQLIKNITGNNEVSPTRKFNEIFQAVSLEKVYSKDQILESYLNIIPLDQSIVGVQAAAKYYFNKDVSQLTVVEGAALAAMVKAPRTYNPILHPEANKERRNSYVLPAMYEEGIITAEELETYKNTDLVTAVDPQLPESDDSNEYNSWFVDAVIEEVIEDLVTEKGWDEDYAESQVMNGGLTIYTTQDTSMQQILEEKYLNDSTFGDGGRENKAQSAMVIMDYNGNIKALVGGRGEKEGDRLFNRATMAVRRPGSSIKPISIYAPAVESNLIHYSSIVEDSPFPTIIDGVVREDWPANSYGRYLGNILIPEAIRRSTNTIPVKLVNQYTPQNSYNFLTQQLGFTTLVGTPDENGQTDISVAPLALGSLNKGMRLTELTAAYQIFNGEGIRTEAHTYTKVLDANGDILLEKNPDITHAISEETSTIMNRLLLNVIEGGEGATGTRAKISGVPIVGKTGTATNDQGQTTDQLFIGCTPDYVAGIWIGNDDNSKLGSYSPTAAWRNVMVDVLAGRSIGEFSFSDNVEAKEYCTETGLLAVDGCPKATGYYKKDNMPDYCSGNHAESQPAA